MLTCWPATSITNLSAVGCTYVAGADAYTRNLLRGPNSGLPAAGTPLQARCLEGGAYLAECNT